MLVIQSKKADCMTKIIYIQEKIADHDHSNKDITAPEFNKLTAESFAARLKQAHRFLYFAARLKQAHLESKSDIINFVKETDFDKLKDITSNKTELNEISKKLKNINKRIKKRFYK